ncbi:unnamed protein product [Candida verbasci]|uniref:Uncharacterized protein n=1 Tax=Candida verbasci TaxID=1227364 RepID=A0A9W4U1W5_9ASCO|nr:unnamed protein product [Candida verbasci]
MDFSTTTNFKNRINTPTKEQIAAIYNPSKRQKLNNDIPRALKVNEIITNQNNYKLPSIGDTTKTNFNNSQFLNSVPSNIIPIVHPPNNTHDFFTDLKTDLNDPNLQNQISGIMKKYPPPIPPPNPQDSNNVKKDEKGGIMIPFIYPPPPIINKEEIPYSLEFFKKKFEKLQEQIDKEEGRLNIPIKRERKQSLSTQRKGSSSTPSENSKSKSRSKSATSSKSSSPDTVPPQPKPPSSNIYIQAPPLPFPPPNYMPYPLQAEKSNLVPIDVFETFLEASEILPRVDMVVASAAGSLFEMKDQAKTEGFDVKEVEMKKKLLEEDEEEKRLYSQQELAAAASDSVPYTDEEYYSRIDTKVYQDPYPQRKNNFVEISQYNKFIKYQQRTSRKRKHEDSETESESEESDPELIEDIDSLPLNAKHKFARRNREEYFNWDVEKGEEEMEIELDKETKRRSTIKSLDELQAWELKNREDIYKDKKYEILRRIEQVKRSKITFRNLIFYDQELKNFARKCELERDEQLVQLKIMENYELLKNSLMFYEDSNKIYKHLNYVLINKLEKLKTFFEYQKDLFEEYVKNGDHEIFDLKSKESNRIYNNHLNNNYSEDIKEIFKNSLLKENFNGIEFPKLSNEEISNINLNNDDSVLVHDFMPLITAEEFNIITGDPNVNNNDGISPTKKSKDASKSKSLKHKIFHNPIYDRLATSGSDTNLSDSNSGTNTPSKRRGTRRGTQQQEQAQTISPNKNSASPNPITDSIFYSDSIDLKLTDTALQNKIMKQFNGPNGARSDEIIKDLKMMGIKTKWPLETTLQQAK